MKLVLTSDWHGERPEDLPEGDVLAITGDLLPVWDHDRAFQSLWMNDSLIPFLGELPYERVIFVAGNHDFLFQDSNKWKKQLPEHVIYLQDEAFEHGGVKFWGSPWTQKFGNWAFMSTEDVLSYMWEEIPITTDVLLVHGPPHMAGDQTRGIKRSGVWLYPPENVGSPSLTEWIREFKPQVVAAGHIHEDYGEHWIDKVPVYNVSLLDVHYAPANAPVVFDLE